MTGEAETRATVRAYLDSDDFSLEEFPEIWLVHKRYPEPMMGAPTWAVERATGALWEFPGNVAPRRVIEEFEEMKEHGRIVEVPSD